MKIKNLTGRLVIISLNSGRTLYVSPNSTADGILNVELKGNPMVERLLQRGVIELCPEKKHPGTAAGTAAGKKKSAKITKKKATKK